MQELELLEVLKQQSACLSYMTETAWQRWIDRLCKLKQLLETANLQLIRCYQLAAAEVAKGLFMPFWVVIVAWASRLKVWLTALLTTLDKWDGICCDIGDALSWAVPPFTPSNAPANRYFQVQQVARLSLDQQASMLAAHSSDDDDSANEIPMSVPTLSRAVVTKKAKLDEATRSTVSEAKSKGSDDEIDDIFSGF